MIRRILTSDMYRPHSFEEISELIAPEVAARLDPRKEYGVQWYNRQRVTVRTVTEPNGDDGRRYRKKRIFKWRPKEDWVAVPVPGFLPRGLVDRVRTISSSARARERKHLARAWELRGMVRCGCGRKMSTRTAKVDGRLYHYYVCNRPAAQRKAGECAQRCIRAAKIEGAVWLFVSELLKDPERIRAGIEELVERERTDSDTDLGRDASFWREKEAECSRLRNAYQDQQAAGLMTLEELRSKLNELDQTRKVAQAEIAARGAREERASQLEADRDSLIAAYVATVPEALDGLTGEERSTLYRMLELEIRPEEEGYGLNGILCSTEPTGRCR